MSNAPTNVSDHDAITTTVQHYIDGAKSGRGTDMKPAFHKEATIFGYAGTDLFAGPRGPQKLDPVRFCLAFFGLNASRFWDGSAAHDPSRSGA